MTNQLAYLQSSPKIFGTVLLSATVTYFVWRAAEIILFNKPGDPSSNMFKLSNWFSSTCSGNGAPKLLEDPEKSYQVKLIEKEEVSHDTRRFRFGLPSEKHVLGLPIGQHIRLSATINGEEVSKSYTPVSSDDDKGYFELVVKIYFKNVHPKFPNGGRMTQHLESLKLGDSITVKGPLGKLKYHGKGQFSIQPDKTTAAEKKTATKLSMIAGGTGIAPMLQLIRDILKKNNVDKTKIALLFANQTEKDILLREELEGLAAKYPEQFKFWYTLDRPEEGWKYSSGFVNKDMIKEHLYEPDEETLILMCGPPPMIKFVSSQLDELNYPQDRRFKY